MACCSRVFFASFEQVFPKEANFKCQKLSWSNWVPLLLEGTLETNLIIPWKSCLLIDNNRNVLTKGNRQLFSSEHFMNDEKAVGLVKTEKPLIYIY